MKGEIYIFTIILFFSFAQVRGQNLCTNGNFDTYTTPPNDYAQVCRATGWLSPSGICSLIAGTGSPDYYNTAGSGGAKPPATWWATVMPHSGGGMEGFVTMYPGSSPNYREYVMRQLSSPLTVGQNYSITMWITNGISSLHQLGANNLGVAFSASPLVQSVGTPIAYVPQCEMSAILYSTTWTQVTFNYTATAAYQYMTIGNFRNDASTATQSFGGSYGCYYYIDDVVVQPATPLPVEWLYFTSTYRDGKNILEWSTASETGSDYFEIQKSTDGKYFSASGQLKAAGNSANANKYLFTDDHFTASCYYRIKQVDFNGDYNYSRIIYAPLPQPEKDELKIFLSDNSFLAIEGFTAEEKKLNIEIYAVNGQLAAGFPELRITNYFSERFNILNLNKGIYFAKVYSGSKLFFEKIWVR